MHRKLAREKVKCDICGEQFLKSSSLKAHICVEHLSFSPYECIYCPPNHAIRVATKHCLRLHIGQYHIGRACKIVYKEDAEYDHKKLELKRLLKISLSTRMASEPLSMSASPRSARTSSPVNESHLLDEFSESTTITVATQERVMPTLSPLEQFSTDEYNQTSAADTPKQSTSNLNQFQVEVQSNNLDDSTLAEFTAPCKKRKKEVDGMTSSLVLRSSDNERRRVCCSQCGYWCKNKSKRHHVLKCHLKQPCSTTEGTYIQRDQPNVAVAKCAECNLQLFSSLEVSQHPWVHVNKILFQCRLCLFGSRLPTGSEEVQRHMFEEHPGRKCAVLEFMAKYLQKFTYWRRRCFAVNEPFEQPISPSTAAFAASAYYKSNPEAIILID